ncbi:hypothetical protein [Thalassobacillus devorans]|uniref:hypothetical protein n=1 Tax=Thalassobacillus devorans TaxID=279813 RepID=UPI00048F9CC0|nr:hypothetical protein [Thalassobacillus devorans]
MNKLRAMLALLSFLTVLASTSALLLMMIKMPEDTTDDDWKALVRSDYKLEANEQISWDEPITEKPISTLPYRQESQDQEVTVENIKNDFQPKLNKLEKQVNVRIDQLIENAIAEYQEQVESGEPVSFVQLYQKYTRAAEALEEKTDEAFQEIYSDYQSELKTNGFSPTEAEDLKRQYEETKESIRTNLLREVASRS